MDREPTYWLPLANWVCNMGSKKLQQPLPSNTKSRLPIFIRAVHMSRARMHLQSILYVASVVPGEP